MNERIRELAGQATIHSPEGFHTYTQIDAKKFAELIVEEMYVFMCNATDNDEPWPSFEQIKQHFGVEE